MHWNKGFAGSLLTFPPKGIIPMSMDTESLDSPMTHLLIYNNNIEWVSQRFSTAKFRNFRKAALFLLSFFLWFWFSFFSFLIFKITESPSDHYRNCNTGLTVLGTSTILSRSTPWHFAGFWATKVTVGVDMTDSFRPLLHRPSNVKGNFDKPRSTSSTRRRCQTIIKVNGGVQRGSEILWHMP